MISRLRIRTLGSAQGLSGASGSTIARRRSSCWSEKSFRKIRRVPSAGGRHARVYPLDEGIEALPLACDLLAVGQLADSPLATPFYIIPDGPEPRRGTSRVHKLGVIWRQAGAIALQRGRRRWRGRRLPPAFGERCDQALDRPSRRRDEGLQFIRREQASGPDPLIDVEAFDLGEDEEVHDGAEVALDRGGRLRAPAYLGQRVDGGVDERRAVVAPEQHRYPLAAVRDHDLHPVWVVHS